MRAETIVKQYYPNAEIIEQGSRAILKTYRVKIGSYLMPSSLFIGGAWRVAVMRIFRPLEFTENE